MKTEGSLDTSLLPDFQQWLSQNQPGQPHLWEYVRQRTNVDLAAAYASLFWPDFLEVEGCVLLAERYDPQEFAQWLEHFKGNTEQLERMLNHVHVYDLILDPAADAVDIQVWEHIGQALLHCWRAALRTQFPERAFGFSYATEPNVYGPTISFWQQHSNPAV